ncbi:hypothetical protein [Methylibium sp.]|uniref:hypothetical protein n=1 Tax=Methylibium sp. TaxID=2067992 RepID=UPI001828B8A7|nr:hypothetical protein [Methylibium sp.]MBA3590527.1 hypothetical protein [Methylibium sp.]
MRRFVDPRRKAGSSNHRRWSLGDSKLLKATAKGLALCFKSSKYTKARYMPQALERLEEMPGAARGQRLEVADSVTTRPRQEAACRRDDITLAAMTSSHQDQAAVRCVAPPDSQVSTFGRLAGTTG